jgi:hypothetical protein
MTIRKIVRNAEDVAEQTITSIIGQRIVKDALYVGPKDQINMIGQ